MRQQSSAGCLTGIVAAFSRIMLLMYWISRPAMMNLAFNTFILPCLGFLFLPFTTLMYAILWSPGIGLTAWDWMWLILAVVCDLMHYSSTAYSNRNQIPGMSTAPTATPPM